MAESRLPNAVITMTGSPAMLVAIRSVSSMPDIPAIRRSVITTSTS
jgi:hypothetical protein